MTHCYLFSVFVCYSYHMFGSHFHHNSWGCCCWKSHSGIFSSPTLPYDSYLRSHTCTEHKHSLTSNESTVFPLSSKSVIFPCVTFSQLIMNTANISKFVAMTCFPIAIWCSIFINWFELAATIDKCMVFLSVSDSYPFDSSPAFFFLYSSRGRALAFNATIFCFFQIHFQSQLNFIHFISFRYDVVDVGFRWLGKIINSSLDLVSPWIIKYASRKYFVQKQ